MLQNIRQSIQGTTAKIVVGLIVISFAFFGIESILVDGSANEIAAVNGEDIYPQQLEQAMDTQKRRLIAMMGENFDPKVLDDELLKPQALEALINRILLMQSAADMDLAISEREIGAIVANMEQFQVDGAFSPDAYKGTLSSAGYTPSYFKQSLRDDLLVGQLRSGLAGSEFITPSELKINARVQSEQRDLRYFTIPQEKFASGSPATEEQIEAYYNTHKEDFRTPESVDLNYVELTLDNFRQPVEESAILEAYELAKLDFQYKTQNRVSHILFESDSENDVQQRLAMAQEKLATGVAFAAVAKELSDDMGSASKGGDLGYSSGDAFPQEMEAVIGKLEPGVVSSPVETDIGTHLILVTERKQGEEPDLEEMRAQLEETLQVDEARIVLLRTVEELRDLSFNAVDLSEPAKELDLTLLQEDSVTRSQKEGLFSNSALLDAAFSEEVLESGKNSDVIEQPDDRFVVLRVRNHHAPAVKPLASVREEVIAALVEEKAREAVVAEANRVLAELHSGTLAEESTAEEGYDWHVELGVNRQSGTVPPDVLRRVFELAPPSGETAVRDFIMTSNGDAVIIELARVSPGEYKSLEESERLQLLQMLSAEFGSLINLEFQRGLRETADITVL